MDSGTVALVVGLAGTIIGGLGTKAIDSVNTRRKTNIDFASQIRSEQRSELMNLRSVNTQLGAEIEDLREKYYATLQRTVDLESKIDEKNLEIDELRNQIDEINS